MQARRGSKRKADTIDLVGQRDVASLFKTEFKGFRCKQDEAQKGKADGMGFVRAMAINFKLHKLYKVYKSLNSFKGLDASKTRLRKGKRTQ